MKWEDLNKEERLDLANRLAKDRLPYINLISPSVIFKETLYTKYVKRLIDIIISLCALIVTLPINLIIGIITLIDVGRPILFKQQRIGKNGKLFTLVKFRNMRNIYDESGDLLPASERVTKFGKFVRKTSLDELLNFWSILKGDMSLIGPRPLLPQYYNRFSNRHRARFAVRPGLECPPRKNRNNIRSWQDQLEDDIWYVQNVSFKVDVKLFFDLIRFALNRKNSSSRGSAIRGSFLGYDLNGNAITYRELPQEYLDFYEADG